MKTHLWCLASLVLGLVACAKHHPFAAGAYHHEVFPVHVDAPGGHFASEDWLVDRWVLDAHEWPIRPLGYGRRADLVLRHRSRSAQLWVDVIPLDSEMRNVPVRELAQGILERRIHPSAGPRVSPVTTAFYDLHYVSGADIAFQGHPGHAAVIQFSIGSEVGRGIAAFVRVDFTVREYRRSRMSPVVLVMGYSDTAEHFPEGVGDFERFMANVSLEPDR